MTQINEQKSYKTDSCDIGNKYKSKTEKSESLKL